MDQTELKPALLQGDILKAIRLLAEGQLEADKKAQEAHARFNVFTTLLKEDDEVRLHTRFLHALLDPRGLHDCGPLFLKLFFATLHERPGRSNEHELVSFKSPEASSEWTVEKETGRSSGFGQIDLLLTHTTCAIAIENKINAPEQPLQLHSYYQFLQVQKLPQTYLIYLTINGKKSNTHEGKQYFRISYAEHILPWLEACLRETCHIIPVNQVLLKYRDVVRQITGKNSTNSKMEDVIKLVQDTPDIVRFRQQLNQAVDGAKARFLDQLAERVMERLKKGGYQPSLLDDCGRFGEGDYGTMLIEVPATSPLARAPFRICLEHDSTLAVLVVGVYIDIKSIPAPDDQTLIQRLKLILQGHENSNDHHLQKANHVWPLGWCNIWENLDDEGFAERMTGPLDLKVDEVCTKTVQYISLLEELYQQQSPDSN